MVFLNHTRARATTSMPDSDAKADAGHTSSGPPKGISKGTPTKQVNREVAYAARASPAPSHASESVESQVGDAASIGDPQDKRAVSYTHLTLPTKRIV